MFRSRSLIGLLVVALIAGGCRTSTSWKEWFDFSGKFDRRTTEQHLADARQYESAGQFERAEEEYAAALRKSPESAAAQQGLTDLQRKRQGEWLAMVENSASERSVPSRMSAPGEKPLFADTPSSSGRESNYDRWQRGLANSNRPQQAPARTNLAAGPVIQPAKTVANDAEMPEWARSSNRETVPTSAVARNEHAVTLVQPPSLQLSPRSEREINPFIVPRYQPDPGPRTNPAPEANTAQAISPPDLSLETDEPQPIAVEPTETFTITSDIAELQSRLIEEPTDLTAIRAVVRRLGDSDRSKRWLAASILENLAETEHRTLVVAQLGQALQTETDAVRVQAALLLGSLGPKSREALPDLRLALQDQNGEVRRAAANAIPKVTE